MYLIGKWNKTKETQRKQDENTEEAAGVEEK